MSEQDLLVNALKLPGGARFFRCALQVNPYDYLVRHKKPVEFSAERDYNAAIIEACKAANVEVIAVTDHFRIQSALGLWKVAAEAGLVVLPGFEAVSKDGVHFLCLFDPGTDVGKIDRLIGDCGIHDDNQGSPMSKYDALDLLAQAHKWGAVCIAAHVASDGGLLRALSRGARANAWKSADLLACSLPGPASDAPDELRPILQNQDPAYKRERAVAIVNAQDINGPDDVQKPGKTCWIKMSTVSVEGLRQAFLDPDSRIRLASEATPSRHTELMAIAWQGGFLDQQAIHFNENLNVLVGGRGTGKSTIIESLRYVLDIEPLGDEAQKAHESIVKRVLRSGTQIALLVCSHQPTRKEYRIERTVPNPPVVKDAQGNLLNLTPADILPAIELYGQHEIAELTRKPEKRTRLLDRFIEEDADVIRRKAELLRELERSRQQIIDVSVEIGRIDERLAALPGLEETLKRFQESGLEDRLREQSWLVREERILKTAVERSQPYKELLQQIQHQLPIDRAFLSTKSLEDLPRHELLAEADAILARLSAEMEEATRRMADSFASTDQALADVRQRWQELKTAAQGAYEKILRELQRASVDGEEFIRLRRQVEDLQPLRERHMVLEHELDNLLSRRRSLLVEWQQARAEEFRQFDRAARKINRRLAEQVRVKVTADGDRQPLVDVLREGIGGRLSETFEALRQRESLSLVEFMDAIEGGSDSVQKYLGITPSQAERLANASLETRMQIAELDLPATTEIELNVAASDQAPSWQPLDKLSTGQKATAVLLLLLLESDAPLIIDQPEDDLDNRFVTDGIVPKMRQEKLRRQFVFATHNANIPVLGDAELIIGLQAAGEADYGQAEMPAEHMGSIDSRPVRELVEELLEGGQAAFEMRRLKYGF
ncbi:hypothetical protein ANRL4_05358 [Anaerolineae bacterium]|nr:hypothetical protein ANRL4_05358 [Anaerolineae bacterium]